MVTGRIGVDIVAIRRVEAMAASQQTTLARMLTTRELDQCAGTTGWDVPGVAGRLAAKEAVFKLFQADDQVLPWLSIEVVKGSGGWPHVQLSGVAADLASDEGMTTPEVSITHDQEYAIAVAIGALQHTYNT